MIDQPFPAPREACVVNSWGGDVHVQEPLEQQQVALEPPAELAFRAGSSRAPSGCSLSAAASGATDDRPMPEYIVLRTGLISLSARSEISRIRRIGWSSGTRPSGVRLNCISLYSSSGRTSLSPSAWRRDRPCPPLCRSPFNTLLDASTPEPRGPRARVQVKQCFQHSHAVRSGIESCSSNATGGSSHCRKSRRSVPDLV